MITMANWINFVVWMLVNIHDENLLNFHPKVCDLVLLPAQEDELESDVRASVRQTER